MELQMEILVNDLLIETRRNVAQGWTKGAMVEPKLWPAPGVNYCLSGALDRAAHELQSLAVARETELLIMDRLKEKDPYLPRSIPVWNDAPERKKKDVLDLLDALIEETSPQKRVTIAWEVMNFLEKIQYKRQLKKVEAEMARERELERVKRSQRERRDKQYLEALVEVETAMWAGYQEDEPSSEVIHLDPLSPTHKRGNPGCEKEEVLASATSR